MHETGNDLDRLSTVLAKASFYTFTFISFHMTPRLLFLELVAVVNADL
jgi:hypothetical protein